MRMRSGDRLQIQIKSFDDPALQGRTPPASVREGPRHLYPQGLGREVAPSLWLAAIITTSEFQLAFGFDTREVQLKIFLREWLQLMPCPVGHRNFLLHDRLTCAGDLRLVSELSSGHENAI